MTWKKKKYTGFTLAEVLVTLSIIGVLAALLIPVIFHGSPDKARAMYKKAVNTLQQAVDGMIFERKERCPAIDSAAMNYIDNGSRFSMWSSVGAGSARICFGGYRCVNFESGGKGAVCSSGWEKDDSCYDESIMPVDDLGTIINYNDYHPGPGSFQSVPDVCFQGKICRNLIGDGTTSFSCEGALEIPTECYCAGGGRPALPANFCQEVFNSSNTAGSVSNCGAVGATPADGTAMENPNFTTSDGIQWWGLGRAGDTSFPTGADEITVVIDINGTDGPNSFQDTPDRDRFRIKVNRLGKVFTENDNADGAGTWVKENEYLRDAFKIGR